MDEEGAGAVEEDGGHVGGRRLPFPGTSPPKIVSAAGISGFWQEKCGEKFVQALWVKIAGDFD